MTDYFLNLMSRYQTTDLGSSENAKHDKCEKQTNKQTVPRHIILQTAEDQR